MRVFLAICRVPCGALLLSEVKSDRILEKNSGTEFIIDLRAEFMGIVGELYMWYKERRNHTCAHMYDLSNRWIHMLFGGEIW